MNKSLPSQTVGAPTPQDPQAVELPGTANVAESSAIIAAALKSAADAEEKVLELRQQLERAKELVRAELDDEFENLRERGQKLDREQVAIEARAAEVNASDEGQRAIKAETKLDEMRRSTSWRVTAPLRAFKRLVSR